MSQYKHTGGNDMISSDSDRTQGDLESSKAPAEALHNYQCLICGHTSSVYKSFMHHMESHET